ncbi:MAG TPA: hypothetical protein VNA25_10345 [Phycisphaerae bacterium]|nr:hypothetical protein [Phycisphaerae bacterium]
MIQYNDAPREAMDDPFCPPAEPCRVCCLHCGQEYDSSQIVWRSGANGAFWCCPVEGCDGAGFGFDIHPVDSPLWEDDEDDDDLDDPDETNN